MKATVVAVLAAIILGFSVTPAVAATPHPRWLIVYNWCHQSPKVSFLVKHHSGRAWHKFNTDKVHYLAAQNWDVVSRITLVRVNRNGDPTYLDRFNATCASSYAASVKTGSRDWWWD